MFVYYWNWKGINEFFYYSDDEGEPSEDEKESEEEEESAEEEEEEDREKKPVVEEKPAEAFDALQQLNATLAQLGTNEVITVMQLYFLFISFLHY